MLDDLGFHIVFILFTPSYVLSIFKKTFPIVTLLVLIPLILFFQCFYLEHSECNLVC